MKKYYLGELHAKNGENDKIYYVIRKSEFIAIKKDGSVRSLNEKQNKYQ